MQFQLLKCVGISPFLDSISSTNRDQLWHLPQLEASIRVVEQRGGDRKFGNICMFYMVFTETIICVYFFPIFLSFYIFLEVSISSPKFIILGFSIINHQFWGTTISGVCLYHLGGFSVFMFDEAAMRQSE